VEALELRSRRRTTGNGRQPLRFRADNGLCTPLTSSGNGRGAKKTRQIRVRLQQRQRDAETHDQRRGADRHDGKGPFGMLFDIRVHVYLRGKAGFVPKAARTQTPSRTRAGSLLLLFPGLTRLRVPAAQTFKGLFRSGLRSRNHVHPALRARWSTRLFWHARGITEAHILRYP
jgi:hypothetical protein